MRSDYKIIVNADDFGHDTIANQAILRSFQHRLIHRTSLMVNLSGFEQAVGIALSLPPLAAAIGLHINLTEGFPLSAPIRQCRLFCNEQGEFIYKRQKSLFFLSRIEQNAVYLEMKAQIEKSIAAGIRPAHLDSHHHVHTEWAIMRQLLRLAKEYGIGPIRTARNMGQRNFLNRAYKTFFNTYLFLARARGTDYFGDIDDFLFLTRAGALNGKTGSQKSIAASKKAAGFPEASASSGSIAASTGSVASLNGPAASSKQLSVEIMVHPLFNTEQELVDDDGDSLEQKLGSLMPVRHPLSPTAL